MLVTRIGGHRPQAQSIVVLDQDMRRRSATSACLARSRYRVSAAADPDTALRFVRGGDGELVLTDLDRTLLSAIPRWARRRDDVPSDGPPLGECYAILRPLDADAPCPRRPIVTLRQAGESDHEGDSPRFAIVGYAPRATAPALLDAVEAVLGSETNEPGARGGASIGLSPAAVFALIPAPLRRVLVVDADAGWVEEVHRTLAGHGFQVDGAQDQENALRLALARRPCLILAGVTLPRHDGADLVGRLRSHGVLRRTPLVLVAERLVDVPAAGEAMLAVDDYLCKPVPAEELVIRLALVMQRHRDRPARHGPELLGSLSLVGAAGALQACRLGRLSGVLLTRHVTREARIGFRSGEIVAAESDGFTGIEAVTAFLGWTAGRFRFVARSPGGVVPLCDFEQLLLEGSRRLDESRRALEPAGV
ncbi:MAG TPA: response regulator [Vicinamibacteria bacterium]|nr:response regulator [Vicinamibacteria bacterium]